MTNLKPNLDSLKFTVNSRLSRHFLALETVWQNLGGKNTEYPGDAGEVVVALGRVLADFGEAVSSMEDATTIKEFLDAWRPLVAEGEFGDAAEFEDWSNFSYRTEKEPDIDAEVDAFKRKVGLDAEIDAFKLKVGLVKQA